ncbi:VanZ family protein [Gelidibacter japonicus]|uniref:VanZ family protein n=1 Tax=Gelidibacter japonicus TaxID=1962232 RepID=UPI0013D3A959|nr:VanZ family protein [Gelidibacter japonicus]MCL8007939.1 VanZ family protein [Gelidibacter japonicus]
MRKFWALAILVVYAIVLLILSLVSIGGFETLGSSFDDKINHFGAYFLLTILIFNYINTLNLKKGLFYALIIASVYGIIMEVLQKYLTNARMFDVYDMIANAFGAIIAVLFVIFYRKLKLK